VSEAAFNQQIMIVWNTYFIRQIPVISNSWVPVDQYVLLGRGAVLVICELYVVHVAWLGPTCMIRSVVFIRIR
jgi:hypothetical protein